MWKMVTSVYARICTMEADVNMVRRVLLLARLESAYSLIRGAHEIFGQSLGTFMISRPI